ncbi:MAG: hypothetical protein FWE37_00475 [Spirochaetaceae bacterium]|nr:hypothetical protein [Spirochaetaceae bacterium]
MNTQNNKDDDLNKWIGGGVIRKGRKEDNFIVKQNSKGIFIFQSCNYNIFAADRKQWVAYIIYTMRLLKAFNNPLYLWYNKLPKDVRKAYINIFNNFTYYEAKNSEAFKAQLSNAFSEVVLRLKIKIIMNYINNPPYWARILFGKVLISTGKDLSKKLDSLLEQLITDDNANLADYREKIDIAIMEAADEAKKEIEERRRLELNKKFISNINVPKSSDVYSIYDATERIIDVGKKPLFA